MEIENEVELIKCIESRFANQYKIHKNHLDIHVIVGVAIRQGITSYKEKIERIK